MVTPRTTPARFVFVALALAAGLSCPAALAAELAGTAGAEAPISAGETPSDAEGSAGEAAEGAEAPEPADSAGADVPAGSGVQDEGASADDPASEEPGTDGEEGDGTAEGSASDEPGASDASDETDEAGKTASEEAATSEGDKAADAEGEATSSARADTLAAAEAEQQATSTYAHAQTSTEGDVTLKVEWDDPVLGSDTTFHVSATGGSGVYKFMMSAPSYTDPVTGETESVADPSTSAWGYTEECASHDYAFTMTASGTYGYQFYVMDMQGSVKYLRLVFSVSVEDAAHPSVGAIVQDAVAQCNADVAGSDYERALWLHDWLLNQLEYDNSLKWASAESALTRGTGTCQAYTNAYGRLLTAAGINNGAIRDEADGHTWNAVMMDGEWYQVDCTWDDSSEKGNPFDRRHLYFGLTDELMAVAHKGHTAIYTADSYATRSTSLADNYFVRAGTAESWASGYVAAVQAHLEAGETSFTVASNYTSPPGYYDIINAITAYALNQMPWSTANGSVTLNASGSSAGFACAPAYTYDGTYQDVSSFKASGTAPTSDGQAFAGWYADAACTEPYLESTGNAYAAFVPLTDLVRYTGCSLRDDGRGADAATLRFCYQFSVPAGCTLTGASWLYANPTSGKSGEAQMARYWLSGGDALVANVAITGVARDGASSTFSTAFSVTGRVSYVTPDGTAVTAQEASARTQSVLGAASEVVSGGMASEAERTLAHAILGESN